MHTLDISVLLLKPQVFVTWRKECRWWAWLAGRWYWRADRLTGWLVTWSKWAWSTHA